MGRNLRAAIAMIAICATLSLTSSPSRAATILKLNLGGTGPDVAMNAGGVFSTVSDGVGATTGDQNTDVEYTDFLDGLFVDIPTPIGSFSLTGVTRSGAPSVFGGLIVQQFVNGLFEVYGPAPTNQLLLRTTLFESALVGQDNGNGNGSYFNITLGNATAGTLVPYLVPGSMSINIPLQSVTTTSPSSPGFLVQGGELKPFEAVGSVLISANQNPVPEPAFGLSVLLAAALSAVSGRRRR